MPFFFDRVTAMLRLVLITLCVAFAVAPAASQTPDPFREQAEVAVHGPDRTGKDGPMASVGMDLAMLYYRYRSHTLEASDPGPFEAPPSMPVQDGGVVIDAVASGEAAALRTDLDRLGLTNGATAGRVVSGRIPILALEQVAGLSSLQSARPSYRRTSTPSNAPPVDAPPQRGTPEATPASDTSAPDVSDAPESASASPDPSTPSNSTDAGPSNARVEAQSDPPDDTVAALDAETPNDPPETPIGIGVLALLLVFVGGAVFALYVVRRRKE